MRQLVGLTASTMQEQKENEEEEQEFLNLPASFSRASKENLKADISTGTVFLNSKFVSF